MDQQFQLAKHAIAQGDHRQAELIYTDMLKEQPDNIQALLALGALLISMGRIHEGIYCNQRVLQLQPGHSSALNNVATSLVEIGRSADALVCYREMLGSVKKPLAYRVASNYLLALQYDLDCEPESFRATNRELGAQFGQERTWTAAVRNKGAMRIGFVSGDLCAHPVGFFLKPLLAHLDREMFTPYLYAQGVRTDWMSESLCTLGTWKNIEALSDAELAELIRHDEIDVLIDLAGHTARNRLPVFATRAAPCQVSWMGYFATTGIPAIDYVIMDRWHAPEGFETQFTEKLVYLPHSRFCFEALPFALAVSPPPHLAKGYVTFGSFNNTAKYNAQLIAAWTAILTAVPNSRLILKWRTFADETFRNDLLQNFAQEGIDRERIELRAMSSHGDLLMQYADIDIALDPFPFSGGYTSCDALWMGVPVVTLPGTRPVSRQTYCMLANLGRGEWLDALAAESVDGYVRKAVSLAGDSAMLGQFRNDVRAAMQSSPLMDAKSFAGAFGEMMHRLLCLRLPGDSE